MLQSDKGTIIGTVGGTVLSTVHSLSFNDIGKSVILGAIGACVSFFVSMFLRWVIGFARSKLKR